MTKRSNSPNSLTSAGPTMADIAKIAGVSTITVSRALANSPLVNEATRTRIQQVAKDNGYSLNLTARNLRLGRTATIAVVVEMTPSTERQMSGPYPLDILGGITQELTSSNYSVLLTSWHDPVPPGIRAADGVILLGQGAHENAVEAVSQWNKPLVVWGATSKNDQITIGSDNVFGGQLAAARFLELKRKHPLFIGKLAHAEFNERYQGFSDHLTAYQVKPNLQEVADLTINEGNQAMRSALAVNPDIDAVFAGSDLLAIGAIQALTDLGKSIPHEVSVIGYDDSPLAAFYTPAITSVHQFFSDAGVRLAKSILEIIDGEDVYSQMLPTELVLRDT